MTSEAKEPKEQTAETAGDEGARGAARPQPTGSIACSWCKREIAPGEPYLEGSSVRREGLRLVLSGDGFLHLRHLSTGDQLLTSGLRKVRPWP